ncbi:hypothetical protein O6H91_12G024700 [Diphasiastrum complanatum]|uniref:Uncharacterized protein n=1 Tax=Diphasiastrum complanatum TaxID=34168 RepID=A0ACC2BZW3_DIPCM|nr:hypothetical protein O6H91_12G024700 [Diphasiastrum complanatum]
MCRIEQNGFSLRAGIRCCCFWPTDSFEFAINILDKIYSVFAADIKKCSESIPLSGEFGLKNVLSQVIDWAFEATQKSYIVFHEIRLKAKKGLWTYNMRNDGIAFDKNIIKFIIYWLCDNMHVKLGDRIWKQIVGIPMGFFSSPIWCNLYLFYFEYKFCIRLAKLNRWDLLQMFSFSFHYVDDFCLKNVVILFHFL